jgi:hypothetical protein
LNASLQVVVESPSYPVLTDPLVSAPHSLSKVWEEREQPPEERALYPELQKRVKYTIKYSRSKKKTDSKENATLKKVLKMMTGNTTNTRIVLEAFRQHQVA